MSATFDEYFRFLEELGQTLDQLTALAQKTAKAVVRDDLDTVNDCMKQEQALSLRLRGLDTKRERILSQLGLSGVPLSGLCEHCPEEIRPQAKKAEERLRERYELFQVASQVSRNTLECNLHQIEKLKAQEGGDLQERSFTDIRA